jgi:hypothetical protein
MKSKLILIQAILLAIAIQSLSGQANYSFNCNDKIYSGPYLSGELFIPAEPLDVVTYFNQGWLLGDIYLANGEVVRDKYIKYNKLLDELFWLEPASSRIIKLDKEGILKFHFLNFQGDTSVYFKRINAKRHALADSSEIFGRQIYKGKLSLFILYNFIIEQRELAIVNGVFCEKNIYGEEPIYYLQFMNNKAVDLTSLSRKSLSATFPDKKDQIKKFFKENRQTEFSTNAELVMLAQFLSSIVTQ